MSGPHPQQQRAARRGMTMSDSGSSDRLLDEWRADINHWRDDSDRSQQQTAIILERLTNRLDRVEAEHDRRLAALETAPDRQREASNGSHNLVAQYWLVACGLLTAAAYLLPHLSFH